MSMTIELESTLKKAEAIFLQLKDCKKLPSSVIEIIGLSPDGSTSSTQTSEASSNASTPSVDRSHLALQTNSNTNTSSCPTHESSPGGASSPGSSNQVTTPDDNSIEMVSSVMTDFVC